MRIKIKWSTKLDIKKIVKEKRFKNTVITLLEILIVAGIIFGGLMFIQNKVTSEADKASKLSGKGVEEETENKKTAFSDRYYIEVNKKLKAVIVYQYSKDKKTKVAVKSFRCSVGKSLPNGNFRIKSKYTWLNKYSGWHKYNSYLDKNVWIQSPSYSGKEDYKLVKSSYRSIGKKKASGKNIVLTANDANWIFENCKKNTLVSVKKGKKKDTLPIDFSPVVKVSGKCGWDPTDPSENNPYKKIKNGTVVKGSQTVTVEKGHQFNYYCNLIAFGTKGKDITGRLKHNTVDTSAVGNYTVKYKYKSKDGKKYSISQKVKVVDTTPPVVSCSKQVFTLEVKSKSPNDINTKKNVQKIIDMVKATVTCNEPTSEIKVYTLEKEQLRESEKTPVVVKAKDLAGNVGSCQVLCEIKVKEDTVKKNFKVNKKLEQQRKKKAGIEPETTKNKKKSSKKK